MSGFDVTQGPVAVQSVEKGSLFAVYQAQQGEKPVGAIRFDWTRQGIMLQTIVGHGHAVYAPSFIKHAEAVLAYTGRITVCFDFWEAPAYDSGLRTGETQWATKNIAKYDAVHVLLQSKIVAMGVSVASLAMGGIIKSYSKRVEFDTLLMKLGFPARRPVPAN